MHVFVEPRIPPPHIAIYHLTEAEVGDLNRRVVACLKLLQNM